MAKVSNEVVVNVMLLRVGTDVLPVFGNNETGWDLYQGDLYAGAPSPYRYASVDELFFALVNPNLAKCGQA